MDLYTTSISDGASFNLFSEARYFPQEFLTGLVFSMITPRPLPIQFKSLKNKLARPKAQAEARFKAKLAES